MAIDDARKLTAEFVGTFALIFVGAGSVVIAGASGLVGIALAHGLVIAVMVSAVGHISGGHFNPAVTFGFLATGRMSAPEAVRYWAAQFAGGIAGALLLAACLPGGRDTVARSATVVSDVNAFQGLLIELVLTFFLGWVIFAVAVDEHGTFGAVAGLPIGLVITFDVLMGGPWTGASMNPARTLGPGLVSGTWEDMWVYFIACPLGAAAASLLYDWLLLGRRPPRIVVEGRVPPPPDRELE
jgi:aquaporin Z